jgi:hypothetical protein
MGYNKSRDVFSAMLNKETKSYYNVTKNEGMVGGYHVEVNGKTIFSVVRFNDLKMFLIGVMEERFGWSEIQTINEFQHLGGRW